MTPYKWPYKWRIGYISLFIAGKTPCRTGLGAHHSKFGGALVVFFPYRISETLVGKQPERFPSSGKPHFFGSKKQKVGPQTKIRWHHKCQTFGVSSISYVGDALLAFRQVVIQLKEGANLAAHSQE